jgi:hypothetical protein
MIFQCNMQVAQKTIKFNAMNTLLKDIQIEIGKINDCDFLPDEESAKLILHIADLFSFDIRQRWMWDNKRGSEIYDCSDSPWEPVLQRLLSGFDGMIFLTVTDDDFFPWKVLHLKKNDLVNLLLELPGFEYFLFDRTMKYVVFETHHNSFLVFEQDNQKHNV